MSDQQPRNVRSFVRRAGRMTRAQHRALADLWSTFGVDYSAYPLNLQRLFGREAPRILEIGFGNGETLAELASRNEHQDFLGVEVHRPGIGHLLLLAERGGLRNVRVISHDAVEVLANQLSERSLAGVNLFFPDPWPKKRHHKRRIVQPAFVSLVASRLEIGGLFHLATDWEPYAEFMLEVIGANPALENVSPNDGFCERPATRPLTKFEQRGRRLGHKVRDLLFRRR